jgi:hypothetical protein
MFVGQLVTLYDADGARPALVVGHRPGEKVAIEVSVISDNGETDIRAFETTPQPRLDLAVVARQTVPDGEVARSGQIEMVQGVPHREDGGPHDVSWGV